MTLQHTTTGRATARRLEELASDDRHSNRELVRSLVADLDDEDRVAVAQAFGYRLASVWWEATAGSFRHSRPLREPLQPIKHLRLPASTMRLADRVGRSIANLPVEMAAYEIGRFYTTMLPPERRSRLGVYYTPPELSSRLIALASEAGIDWTRCRVLDPACGGGAFLAPIAQKMIETLKTGSPKDIIQTIASRLRGYEIDPFGAWLSQVAVDATLVPLLRRVKTPLPLVVSVCNSLEQPISVDRFDLVIGNPPYGRVRLDATQRARFKRSLYGHANLYGLFTDLALQYTAVNGVIAYVTPTSFLAGEYFKNLRQLIGSFSPPVSIDFVSLRKGVFDDVLQETLLSTYKRGHVDQEAVLNMATPINGTKLNLASIGRFRLPKIKSQPWMFPRSQDDANLFRVLQHMKHRLSDWGYGISTGPLVWNRYKPQLSRRPGKNCVPLIWAEAVTSDGDFKWRAEKKHHLPYFELHSGDDWLVTNEPCVLLQRTTAKEQRRRLIAATLPSSFLDRYGAVVVENHLNMIRPIVKKPKVPAELVAIVLNSFAADRAFRCLSGSVAVSAYEIEALPLPAPEDLSELDRLVKANAGKPEFEEACAALYRIATAHAVV